MSCNRPTFDAPVSLLEIADVLGFDAAMTLVAILPQSGHRRHRRSLWIPRRHLPDDHWLMIKLGPQRARQLQYEFGGMLLQPSNGNFWVKRVRAQRICHYADRGMPIQEIAERMGVSADVVQLTIRRKPPRDTIGDPE